MKKSFLNLGPGQKKTMLRTEATKIKQVAQRATIAHLRASYLRNQLSDLAEIQTRPSF